MLTTFLKLRTFGSWYWNKMLYRKNCPYKMFTKLSLPTTFKLLWLIQNARDIFRLYFKTWKIRNRCTPLRRGHARSIVNIKTSRLVTSLVMTSLNEILAILQRWLVVVVLLFISLNIAPHDIHTFIIYIVLSDISVLDCHALYVLVNHEKYKSTITTVLIYIIHNHIILSRCLLTNQLDWFIW